MKTSAVLAALGLALSLGTEAADQTQGSVPRIGFLSQCSCSFDKAQFTQGLRDLGYAEVTDIHIRGGISLRLGLSCAQRPRSWWPRKWMSS